MITPDAKCVNNGKKVNETISALNPLLGMSVGYTAGGNPPQVTYNDAEVKILLPLADSVEGFSLEELDIVDSNNAASSRYFMTSLSSVSTYGTTTASTSGTTVGKQSTSQPTNGRNKLNDGGNNAGNNRDKLNTGGALRDTSGDGVAPVNKISGALRDDGNRPRVDQFGNTIGGTGGALRDDGTTTAGGGINSLNRGGALRDDGTTTAGGGINSLNTGGALRDDGTTTAGGGDTTPPPTPGAPPLGGDTTPKTKRGKPSRSTGIPIASQESIDAGQWLPQEKGMINLQELGKIVAAGNASQYQKDFYNNATANSLPLTDGKINLQAIGNNIKEGTATPYEQDFYNKAMGIDTPAGESAASGKDAPADYYVDGIKAHVTEQGKNKPVLNRDRRKEKGPTRRRKQFSPIIEAQAAVKRLEDRLFKAKKEDKLKYDWNTNMWVYKKSGDPDSALVTSLKSQLKSAKARVKRMKKT